MRSKNILDLKPGDFLGNSIRIEVHDDYDASGGQAGTWYSILGKIEGHKYGIYIGHIQQPLPFLVLQLYDEEEKETIGSYLQIPSGSNTYVTLDISLGDFIVTDDPTYTSGFETLMETINLTINVPRRLFSILYRVVSKIDTLSYKTDRLLTRFTKSYDVLASSAVPSGFTKNEAAAMVIGGSIYQRIRTTKSSNWGTGNITNTQTASMVINKTNYNTDYPEETMGGSDWGYNIQGITGNSGGLKSYYTANSGTTRTYNIAAVETADTSVKITQISSTVFEQV